MLPASTLLSNPHSLCSPKYLDYQADLEALHQQRFERSPAVLSSPDHCWAPVNPQAWAFFRGDIPLAMMPGDQLSDRLKAAFEEVALFFDVEDRLKEIQAPTLVVGGRHDPIVPVEESIAVHESIPNSSLLVLEHSGHGADVEVFHTAALRFLSQL
jgi:pimeloyl-ACP methyl ester carboxylesterase